MTEKENYCLIDIVKFICSIIIVIFHVLPDSNRSTFVYYFSECIGRVCVPFFFITTGYFLKDANKEKIFKYIIRIIKLYLIASIIYLPFLIYGFEDLEHLFRSIFINGSHYHLWYFLALIFALLCDLILRKSNTKIQYLVIGILFSFGIFLMNTIDCYYLDILSLKPYIIC